MKTVNSSIEKEIISLNADIAKCESFTEKEMQEYFNTDDTKEEFLMILKEELSFYEKQIEEKTDCIFSGVDEGFADMQDYINYKFY